MLTSLFRLIHECVCVQHGRGKIRDRSVTIELEATPRNPSPVSHNSRAGSIDRFKAHIGRRAGSRHPVSQPMSQPMSRATSVPLYWACTSSHSPSTRSVGVSFHHCPQTDEVLALLLSTNLGAVVDGLWLVVGGLRHKVLENMITSTGAELGLL